MVRIRTFLKRSPPKNVEPDINDLARDTIGVAAGEIARHEVLLKLISPSVRHPYWGCVQLQQVIFIL
jgi:hypothetical protein